MIQNSHAVPGLFSWREKSGSPSAQMIVISSVECLKAGGHPDVSMTSPPEETPPARS
jgi:hypothetical protein